jgi:hypothetical protein
MNVLSRIFARTPSLRTRVVVATAIGAAIPVLIVGTVVWVGITSDRNGVGGTEWARDLLATESAPQDAGTCLPRRPREAGPSARAGSHPQPDFAGQGSAVPALISGGASEPAVTATGAPSASTCTDVATRRAVPGAGDTPAITPAW